ncbi:MAG TPA: gamma-glutamyl-phosphate reductase, partial [Spirochaetia bacterium]|nr:gamma-glutamyl-phosphate reductase [Spirochaetia bacterium]
MSDLEQYVTGLARAAQKASIGLRSLSASKKNAALQSVARAIDDRRDAIRAANAKDVECARTNGLSSAMVDRLTLTDARITDIITAVRDVAALEDP